jgi:hypothetical protein
VVERMGQMISQTRRVVFQPMIMFVVVLGGVVGLAVMKILQAGGFDRSYYVYYYIPMLAPFGAYAADRFRQSGRLRALHWVVDLVVLVISVMRAFRPFPPFISGHAFFLTYVIMTTQSWTARLAAGVIMLEVIYLKLFAWHDATLFGGIAAGLICGYFFRRISETEGH